MMHLHWRKRGHVSERGNFLIRFLFLTFMISSSALSATSSVVIDGKVVDVDPTDDRAVLIEIDTNGLELKGEDQDQTMPLAAPICNNRLPTGPGDVVWYINNPSGQGYSVKPESSNNLIWAAGFRQNIDGIYQRNWGCQAMKVPDSCTANIYLEGGINKLSCCCNYAAAQLGYVCEWINTANAGWPRCPL